MPTEHARQSLLREGVAERNLHLVGNTVVDALVFTKSLIEEQQMRTEMMAYKFESLKGQINPSFLFESFSSLKELIQSDQKTAVNAIQKMSRLYRSMLETKDMELVSLEDEMSVVGLYLDLILS